MTEKAWAMCGLLAGVCFVAGLVVGYFLGSAARRSDVEGFEWHPAPALPPVQRIWVAQVPFGVMLDAELAQVHRTAAAPRPDDPP